jgi:tetratricopeptide (TPR) repeat protein
MNHEQNFFEQSGQQRTDKELSSAKKAFLLVQEGALFAVAGDYAQAIASYDKALEIQPNNFSIWDVRGDALRRLSHYKEAVASYDKALEIKPDYAYSWWSRGDVLEKLGLYEEAIVSYDKALEIQPDLHRVALNKSLILIKTGKVFNSSGKIGNLGNKEIIFNNIIISSKLLIQFILNTPLKYLLLFLITFSIVSVYGDKTWVEVIKQGFSIIFSTAIFILIAREVWVRRSKINFVYTIYFNSGILSYFRAFLIAVITIFIGSVIYIYAPDFLRWGWGNLIFGNSANLALQPIDTAYQASQKVNEIQGNSFDYGWLFLFPVWLLLILVLPFWAEVEEKIFRKGVHSWKKIAINSLNFGLIHLTMGIPICWALTLALPGFLFACRYKYVYHRHLKKFHDDQKAQEAGVQASTADHAIYNAIVITLSIAGMLLVK